MIAISSWVLVLMAASVHVLGEWYRSVGTSVHVFGKISLEAKYHTAYTINMGDSVLDSVLKKRGRHDNEY